MYRLYSLEMNSERRTELVDEELLEDKDDFFCPEDNGDEDECDEEPQEREYCD